MPFNTTIRPHGVWNNEMGVLTIIAPNEAVEIAALGFG
jgi:hypothetical protein